MATRTFFFSRELWLRLNNLARKRQESVVETIRMAILILDYLVKRQSEGAQLFIRYRDGKEVAYKFKIEP